jgi:hypothetical protein
LRPDLAQNRSSCLDGRSGRNDDSRSYDACEPRPHRTRPRCTNGNTSNIRRSCPCGVSARWRSPVSHLGYVPDPWCCVRLDRCVYRVCAALCADVVAGAPELNAWSFCSPSALIGQTAVRKSHENRKQAFKKSQVAIERTFGPVVSAVPNCRRWCCGSLERYLPSLRQNLSSSYGQRRAIWPFRRPRS